MMKFAFKMMDFVLKTRNSVLQVMDLSLKMMDFQVMRMIAEKERGEEIRGLSATVIQVINSGDFLPFSTVFQPLFTVI